MQVVYHLGAHATDQDRLIRCLLRNRGVLAHAGTEVPPPGRYRALLRETLLALRGAAASAETEELLLDAIADEDAPDRIVFSHELFLGMPQRVVDERGFYANAARNVAGLANLFPGQQSEFHLALVNPALLVPDLIRMIPGANYASVMGGIDPLSLRWLPVLQAMTETAPDATFTVWCNEDTPLIWPEVLREVAGVGPEVALEGENDLVCSLLTPEGSALYATRLAGARPGSGREVTVEFLQSHARPDAMDRVLDLPGWTDGLIAAIGRAYDADVAAIAALPGVEFIFP
jgi:hypothetical protein